MSLHNDMFPNGANEKLIAEQAIIYAIDHQKSRRNLTTGQLALLATTRYDLEQKIEARKRQEIGWENLKKGDNAPVSRRVGAPGDSQKGKSSAIIANEAGVTRSVYAPNRKRPEGSYMNGLVPFSAVPFESPVPFRFFRPASWRPNLNSNNEFYIP